MNNLPSKTTFQLIESLESGEIDVTEAARRIAQVHTVKSEAYAQTLIGGMVLAGIAWAVTGGSAIIPAVIAYLTWDTYQTERKERLQSFNHISQGKILEYLPDADRELFTELLSETQSQQEIQNPDDQGTTRAESETQSQQGTQPAAAASQVKIDIAAHFLENLRCAFLCAPPRTGKGVVAAAIMNGFKRRFPDGWLGSCTIKQFNLENWYWQWSDRHINPSLESGIDPIATAKEIYSLYLDWMTTPSSPMKPSLLIIDELRDTLLRLKGVIMSEVSSDFPNGKKDFTDWLRDELVSAATMNQCHDRYVLLIAPVNTATALTFTSANALQSYAAYVLVTPSELSFTKAGNSVFSAPTIAAVDEKFTGWHGLGWSTKGSQWLGIPKVNAVEISQKYQAKFPGSSSVQTVEPGSKLSSNREPGSSLVQIDEPYTRQSLEASFENSVHSSKTYGSDLEPTPNRLSMVRELNRREWSQTEIIEFLWGVKKGGTRGYQIALDEYREIVSQLNATDN
jgi:hypothetical protein